MSFRAKNRRRCFGVICIALAIAMLIAGETVLKTKLSGVPLLCYWLTCFALTMLAVAVAVIDAARVRHGLREQHRTLLEETLRSIEREKKERDHSKS